MKYLIIILVTFFLKNTNCFLRNVNKKNDIYESIYDSYEPINNQYESIYDSYEPIHNQYESIYDKYDTIYEPFIQINEYNTIYDTYIFNVNNNFIIV